MEQLQQDQTRVAVYSTAGHDYKKGLSPSSFHKYTNNHYFQAEGEISCSWIMLSLDTKDTKLRERRGEKTHSIKILTAKKQYLKSSPQFNLLGMYTDI